MMKIAVLLFAAFMVTDNITAQDRALGNPGGPYIIGDGVKAPIALRQPLPAYTEEARQARIEGFVLIQAIIRKDGTADTFKVLRGLGYGLDESAIQTIAFKWRFKPGTLNGTPVDVYANIEVSFRLSLNPEKPESPKEYPLRADIVEVKWTRNSNGDRIGAGYGNLWTDASLNGFLFDCSCGQPFERSGYPAKWLDPKSRIEMALGFDESTGKQKVCELHVTMQNGIYSQKDGHYIDPQDNNPK
jgi:TonB family protein